VINGIPAWTPSVIDWTGLPEVISRRDKVLRRVVAALQNTGGLSFRAINGGNIYLCRK
jgi:hypothetical protein